MLKLQRVTLKHSKRDERVDVDFWGRVEVIDLKRGLGEGTCEFQYGQCGNLALNAPVNSQIVLIES